MFGTSEYAEAAGPQVSCSSCEAACCRSGFKIALSTPERVKSRMRLRVIFPPEVHDQILPIELQDKEGNVIPSDDLAVLLPGGHGLYELDGDCSNLTRQNECSIYENPDRPKACGSFEPGSIECLMARAAIGLQD